MRQPFKKIRNEKHQRPKTWVDGSGVTAATTMEMKMFDREPKLEMKIPKSLKPEHAFDWATRFAIGGSRLHVYSRVRWYHRLHEQLRLMEIRRVGIRATPEGVDLVARTHDGEYRGLLANMTWDDPQPVVEGVLRLVLIEGVDRVGLELHYSRRQNRGVRSGARIGLDPECGPFPESWAMYRGTPVMELEAQPLDSEYVESVREVVLENEQAIVEGDYEEIPENRRGFGFAALVRPTENSRVASK